MNDRHLAGRLLSVASPYCKKNNKKVFLTWLLWAIVFGIAYTQSPLYTSNQNQYFLHGFAQAGIGDLRSDWLANTLDPTPVFSILVRLVVQFLHPVLFYFIYAILLGIYLFTLVGIIRSSRDRPGTEVQDILLIFSVIAFHSAGWRFALSRGIGPEWSYILEDGLADQRLLGPVLQPSSFGVLLLLSIYLFLQSKPIKATMCAVSAAIIHPTYLLAAAGIVIAYIVIEVTKEIGAKNKVVITKNFHQPLLIGSVALLLVSPILLYTFQAFNSSGQSVASQAREILINTRIPHHAIVNYWFDETALVKMMLYIVALFFIRRTKLFQIMFLTGMIAFFLTIIQIATNNDLLALTFPWRVSIFLIPLSTFLLTDRFIGRFISLSFFKNIHRQNVLIYAFLIIVIAVVFAGITRQVLDENRKMNVPEVSMYRYLEKNQIGGTVTLIPVKLQDFRLETGLPIFVDFKSIPYQDKEVLEWHRRLQLADQFYKHPSCEQLDKLVSEENITHFVLPSRIRLVYCEKFAITYHDENYFVLSFVKPDD